MSDTVIIAIISLIGTAIGSFGGIVSSQKIVKYRLTQLEEKVDRHNKLLERVTGLELLQHGLERRVEHIENKVA